MYATLFLLCLAATSAADPWLIQDGAAQVEVHDPRLVKGRLQVALSGELRLTVRVEGTETMEIEPLKDLVRSEGWEVRALASSTRPLPGGKQVWSQSFVLDPLLPAGNADLQLNPLRYRVSADQPQREVQWPAIPLEIVTVIDDADPERARDVAPIEQDPPPAPPDLLPVWIACAIATVSLALVGVGLWHRRRKPEPHLSPSDHARREIALLAQTPPPADDPSWHAFRVSAILRTFLDRQFSTSSLHQTTAEIVAGWNEESPLPPVLRPTIKELLERCDLARFTGIPPTRADRAALLEAAVALLDAAAAPANSR